LKRQIEIVTTIEEFDSIEELEPMDRELLQKARECAKDAYAPYSDFLVGAALLLEDGTIVLGNNQENVAYPSGLCAERVAVYAAGANYPGVKFKTIAVTARSNRFLVDHPVPPCGACRQAICEYENISGESIRMIMSGQCGKVHIVESAGSLLPLVFSRKELQGES
jgi:cytidine deaminase